jgi:hypothetical protein
MPSALERVLVPGYLEALEERTIDEVRAMRAECDEVETGLSLLRRLVQGHLDIVDEELARRAGGGVPGDRGALLDRLPEVLADRVQSPGPGRLPTLLVPESLDPDLEAELEHLVGARAVLDPSGSDDDELRSLADALRSFEAKVSGHRQSLFALVDALQAELARRYRTGDASIDTLLS